MRQNDTVRLLRECQAGVKMGVSSISQTLPRVRDPEFRQKLAKCRRVHEQLEAETGKLLGDFCAEGKDPNAMAKSMAWMKSEVMMAFKASDGTAADLITDGCNMGVKSLNRYLNQYVAAGDAAKGIARRLIDSEHQLTLDIREYL